MRKIVATNSASFTDLNRAGQIYSLLQALNVVMSEKIVSYVISRINTFFGINHVVRQTICCKKRPVTGQLIIEELSIHSSCVLRTGLMLMQQ